MTGTPSVSRGGRHRKPRPRKVLFAAGGLALAAGVLSLVRMAPEGGVGTSGTAEAEPRLDPTADATDRSANSAATVGPVPTAASSAATVMGGASPTPTATAAATPSMSPSVSPTALPGRVTVPTTIPTGPARPAGTSPAPATSAPAATPTPTPTPLPSAQQPGHGVCLPIVGLCVDPLLAPGPRTPRRGG
ncbi:hypothetical protein ABZ357_04250 [Streptomyces sp. NPDC005917]|uniref:hypothetical protein n=1 Tax=unclassified Streptomyces TaxID=2593676 RepID=UPI0033F6CFB6